MVNNIQKNSETKEIPVEERLRALYKLQKVVSEIDKIRTLRGELPLEVKDLEDEIEGLRTRVRKYQDEILSCNQVISQSKLTINDANAKIAKKEEEKNNVRNNREFDAICKEIDYQNLEIALCTKNITDKEHEIANRKSELVGIEEALKDKMVDLDQKKNELNEIIAETKQQEEQLINKAKELESMIEERLLNAFKRIRKNARNGLAVVTVERDACGGCFNKIPPQRQLDIKTRKKIIVCEYCGRILVDTTIDEEIENSAE